MVLVGVLLRSAKLCSHVAESVGEERRSPQYFDADPVSLQFRVYFMSFNDTIGGFLSTEEPTFVILMILSERRTRMIHPKTPYTTGLILSIFLISHIE